MNQVIKSNALNSLLRHAWYNFTDSKGPKSYVKVPYNINVQQNANYLKKIERSQQSLEQNQKQIAVPRRKRRIYDRERIDRNIDGYGAFRVFEQEDLIYKINEHSMTVARKIMIQPKLLVHAFGMGSLPVNHPRSSHREYQFMDNLLNRYFLYEYRNTTNFKSNVDGYNYQDQTNLHPRMRITKRLSPQDFWNSQQKFQFRLNTSLYAQQFKFEEWLLREIEKRKQKKSYDQYIDEKFGTFYTFNHKAESNRFQVFSPMVTQLTPEDFEHKKQKNEKKEKKVKADKKAKKDESEKVQEKVTDKGSEKKVNPKVTVIKKLDQIYRIKQKKTNLQGDNGVDSKSESAKAK